MKIAKDINIQSIPSKITVDNVQINELEIPDVFASFFKNKIMNFVKFLKLTIVCIMCKKVAAENQNFMAEDNIIKAINSMTINFDSAPVQITINGSVINSKSMIDVLGIIFDSKLQWGPQVENAIKKSNKAKHVNKQIL